MEPPGNGDLLRTFPPKVGQESVNFAMLNRGKRSLSVDLKQVGAARRLDRLVAEADILVEQFRPGVMARLGMGYEDVQAVNPKIIYCSITGYGQSGPKAQVAAHDLNYCAEVGMLSLAGDRDGRPPVPATLVADIAGGSYPAVMNILLALRQRDVHGTGSYLDIAMTDNLFGMMHWAIGAGTGAGAWPPPGGAFLTGGSPRYAIYETADARFIAAAPLEPQFWQQFCKTIELPPDLRDDGRDPDATKRGVAGIIRTRTADAWRARFAGRDVCCSVVARLEDALQEPHFRERGLFDRSLSMAAATVPALCGPVVPVFRDGALERGFPPPGEGNAEMLA